MFQEIAMKLRAAGPNQWEIFQTVPNPSGLSSAPPVDEVVLTLTDTDLTSVLHTAGEIDNADGSISALMKAHAAAAAHAASLVPGAEPAVPGTTGQ